MRMRSRDHLHLSHQVVLCITSVHSSKLYVLLMLTSVNICEHHLLTSANICEHHLWTSVNTFVCNQSLSNQCFCFIYNPLTIFCFCLASYLKVNMASINKRSKKVLWRKSHCAAFLVVAQQQLGAPLEDAVKKIMELRREIASIANLKDVNIICEHLWTYNNPTSNSVFCDRNIMKVLTYVGHAVWVW